MLWHILSFVVGAVLGFWLMELWASKQRRELPPYPPGGRDLDIEC